MKKHILPKWGAGGVALAFLCSIAGSVWLPSTAHAFAGGDGSEASPYQIASCQSLQDMRDDLDAYYVLTQNIECSDSESLNDGAGFQSIGTIAEPFVGSFDGEGHVILDLTIPAGEGAAGGLFAYIGSEVDERGTVQNVGLQDADVTANDEAGILAGENYGEISNVFTTGSATSLNDKVGGLVGQNIGSITNAHSTANVTTQSGVAGGLAGSHVGEITQSYATGHVHAQSDIAGGLVGYNDGSVTRSYANNALGGDENVGVEAACEVGGLFGTTTNEVANVSNNYSRSSVVAYDTECDAGGFTGYLNYATIAQSYSTGSVVGGASSYQGAFIGDANSGGAVAAFWDTETSGETQACGGSSEYDCDETVIGKTTAEMKTQSTFVDGLTEDAFDFETIWGIDPAINDGYPYLRNVGATLQPVDRDNDSPDSEDLNGDGVADSSQPYVGSFTSTATNKTIAVETSSDCDLITAVSKQETDFAIADPGYNYTNGFAQFSADCGTPGYTSTVKLFYYDVAKGDLILRKHNPNTNAYFTLDGTYNASVTETTIGGRTVTVASYQVVDGGVLDMDGQANGTIVDPAGLAAQIVSAPNTGLGGRE